MKEYSSKGDGEDRCCETHVSKLSELVYVG